MIEYIRMAFLQRESDQSSRCPLIRRRSLPVPALSGVMVGRAALYGACTDIIVMI